MTYLQQQFGYKARRDDLAAAQKQLDPTGVTSYLPGLRRARLKNYTTSGPNFLWCLDGHDKLVQYGIEIYTAIDAYSHKIVWFYCGNSNRTPISVLKQYLNAVKAVGVYPRFLCTDKGIGTVLLADYHFSLFIEAALREQWSEAEYEAIRISDCYIYGPSTRDMRAEGLWRQQRYQDFNDTQSPPGIPTAAAAAPPEAPSAPSTSVKQRQTVRQRKPISVRYRRQPPAMNATTASFLSLRQRQRA
jgi:hypothetical protein